MQRVVLLGGQGLGLVQLLARVLEALQANVNLGQRGIHVTVVRGPRKLCLGQRQRLVHLAHVRQLTGIHQLHAVVLGKRCGGLGGCGGRFLPHVRVAIGIHLALVAAHRVFAAITRHLLVRCYRLGGLVLFAIDIA